MLTGYKSRRFRITTIMHPCPDGTWPDAGITTTTHYLDPKLL